MSTPGMLKIETLEKDPERKGLVIDDARALIEAQIFDNPDLFYSTLLPYTKTPNKALEMFAALAYVAVKVIEAEPAEDDDDDPGVSPSVLRTIGL